MKKIGILQCGNRPDALKNDFPCYGEMLKNMMITAGMTAEQFSVFDIINVSEIQLDALFTRAATYEGYIISGSKYGAYDDCLWIKKLQKFIHNGFIAQQKTFIGICFGHQIIAQSLGGVVEKSQKGWGYGIQTYALQCGKHLFADKDSLRLYGIHGDQVVTKPPLADVIASSQFCPYAILDYRGENGGRAFSVQAHPEFSAHYEQELMALYSGKYWSVQQAADTIAAIEKNPDTDAVQIARHIAAFFESSPTLPS